MGDLILTKVLQGFQSDNDFKTARDLLLMTPFISMAGQIIALKSAANFRLLRKNGVTVRKKLSMSLSAPSAYTIS